MTPTESQLWFARHALATQTLADLITDAERQATREGISADELGRWIEALRLAESERVAQAAASKPACEKAIVTAHVPAREEVWGRRVVVTKRAPGAPHVPDGDEWWANSAFAIRRNVRGAVHEVLRRDLDSGRTVTALNWDDLPAGSEASDPPELQSPEARDLARKMKMMAAHFRRLPSRMLFNGTLVARYVDRERIKAARTRAGSVTRKETAKIRAALAAVLADFPPSTPRKKLAAELKDRFNIERTPQEIGRHLRKMNVNKLK